MRLRPADWAALLRSHPGRRRLLMTALRPAHPALRGAAILYRRTALRRTRFVAVVGSYGKSTTVRALATLLCGGVHPYAHNNAGFFVAHAVLRARPGQRHAVVEVGIARPGQMTGYARTLRPDVAVVTCIGSEHHRSLHTLEATRAEKAKMVESLPRDGLAVLCGDDPNVLWMRDRTAARVVTFGRGKECDFRAEDVTVEGLRGMRFTLHRPGGPPLAVHTPLLGEPGVRAALTAFAVGLCEGVPAEAVQEAVAGLAPTPMRLEPVELPNGAVLLRDEQKSSLETIDTALDVLAEMPARRKLCVMGDVSEPPGSAGPIYRRLGARMAAIADEVIVVGPNFQRYAAGAVRAGMPRDALFDAGRDLPLAIRRLRERLGPGDVALLKGRDTQRLDRIALALLGFEVRCAISFCDAKVTRCRHCKMLTTGWEGRRVVV